MADSELPKRKSKRSRPADQTPPSPPPPTKILVAILKKLRGGK